MIITAVGMRAGQPHTVTAEIDDGEIARRKTRADARRAERKKVEDVTNPIAAIQHLMNELVAAKVLSKTKAEAIISGSK